MSKVVNTISFLIIAIGAIWCQEQLISGSEGVLLQLTLISIILNGALGLYLHMQEEIDMDMEDYMHSCKLITPALFTTHLFDKNDVLGEYWNFAPLVVTVLVAFSQFLVDDEVSRYRLMKMVMVLNCAAQLYCSQGDKCIIAEAILLMLGYWLYQSGECRADISPSAQYNYLTGGFCMLIGNCPF